MSFTLKRLRQEAGLTLEALAQASGLTRSYVSKIERGLSAPSVGVALNLAKVLRVPVERLFGTSPGSETLSIFRAADQPPSDGPRIVAGASGHHGMTAFVLSPGRRPRKPRVSSHEGEEILYVLKGAVSLRLSGRSECLNAGDCVQFDASIPHSVEAVGASEAEVLLVVAPPAGSRQAPADTV
jgi:transcriptional regulator with XRE-family HTH domain